MTTTLMLTIAAIYVIGALHYIWMIYHGTVKITPRSAEIAGVILWPALALAFLIAAVSKGRTP